MSQEYFAYGSVLEALSSGLYPDKRYVIREFVQNAFDALNDWRRISKEQSLIPVEINVQKPSIFIADHGLGMDENDAQKFRYLGYSTKDGIATAGFRGIGKDSGLAVAEKIIVTTSRYGVPKRYTVVINAQEMLEETTSGKNPPLDELLRKHNTIKEERELNDSHYTFVELHKIRKDAYTLFDADSLREHLCRNCPVPFDPNFEYASEVTARLKSYVPTFADVDIIFNGGRIYKLFPQNYGRPEYELIFSSGEDGAPLVAYCWYCGHIEKGQFPDSQNSGLIYRIKNFAIGDRQLTRTTLWKATPERAFYFFGEIHILDKLVIPSSDRRDFKDNDARTNLFEQCRRIAQILSRRAGVESEQRRFDESITLAEEQINQRRNKLEGAETPIEIKPQVEFEIRKAIEDIEKRLDRTASKKKQSDEDQELIKRGNTLVIKGKELLRQMESKESFVDIRQVIELNDQAKQVYQIVIDCLKEDFSHDIKRLERIVNRINEALAMVFKGLAE